MVPGQEHQEFASYHGRSLDSRSAGDNAETGFPCEGEGKGWLDEGRQRRTMDCMVFAMQGKTGELNLLELGDSGPKLLARAKVLEGRNANVWAPMALSEGKLLVRDQHQMKCLKCVPLTRRTMLPWLPKNRLDAWPDIRS
jgi:hypothetical protein